VNSQKGFTLLELLIAGTLFMVFVIQIGSLWTSMDKHIGYIADRIVVAREARTARALLLGDLAGSASVTLGVSEVMTVHYTGPGVPDVTYSNSAGSLLRTDAGANWSLPAARYLESASYTLEGDGSLRASLSFRKGQAQTTLNVFMDLPG